MRMFQCLATVAILAIGCGDNVKPDTTPSTPTTVSSVGGAQTSRSKSYVLVTNVSPFHGSLAESEHYSVKPPLGGE